MLYVFNIKSSSVDAHPVFISGAKIKRIIRDTFMPSDQRRVGDLLCFLEGATLMHSALIVGQDRIFEQTGGGGIFQIGSLAKRLRTFSNAGMEHLSLQSYRPRE